MSIQELPDTPLPKRKCVLAMIVAEEAPVIGRCLDSVRHLIDQVVISLNGPDDGSEKLIHNWGQQHQIPVVTWWDKWKGYGPNKTRNLAKVKAEFETDYILWLDADEVYVTNPKDPLSYPSSTDALRLWAELDAAPHVDLWRMTTHYCGLTYPRWQIVRNNQVWIWHLPYQECLEGEVSNRAFDLTWLFNLSRREGHSSRNPSDYAANVSRLEKWIRRNPGHRYMDRALFYTGRGYFATGSLRSVEYLEKRLASTTGFYQERYIAALDLARLNSAKRVPAGGAAAAASSETYVADPARRRGFLLQAIAIDPHRLEAYYKLLRDAQRAEQHRQALSWAVAAPNTRVIPAHGMFNNVKIYEYLFDFWLTVSAFYAAGHADGGGFTDSGLFQMGYEAGMRARAKIAPALSDRLEKNLAFYLPRLPQAPAAPSPSAITTTSPAGAASHRNTTLIVIDGFYENPMEMRQLAMAMPFPVTGNYPGARTAPHIIPGTKERFEALLGTQITYWPTDNYNGSFQIALDKDGRSWVHRDATDWSVVVFLTPDAPVHSGTILYQHKETGLTRTSGVKELEDLLNLDSNRLEAWHVFDRIGNRFNRAILFRGRNSHKSDEYFGTSLADGRLFQTFFFNTVA